MAKGLAFAIALAALVVGAGAEVVDFHSTGTFSEGLYWLEDHTLKDTATWVLAGIPAGRVELGFHGYTRPGKDVWTGREFYARLFWRPLGAPDWRVEDFVLTVGLPEGELVGLSGKISFSWEGGGVLELKLKRLFPCSPRIGVDRDSFSLISPAFPEPEPVLPPEPEPEPEPELPCLDVSKPVCYTDAASFASAFGIPIPEVPIEERTLLPDTASPGEAYLLEEGHYWGTIGGVLEPWGVTDTQDWYKVVPQPGEAAVIYIAHIGAWDYEFFIYDICGYYREKPKASENFCIVPYSEEDRSGYLLRIFRKGGYGEYLISVFYVDLCP